MSITMNTTHRFQALAASTLTLVLAGCGGSGAPASTAPSPVPVATAVLQGLWQSPAGAATNLAAVALPDGKLWAIASTGNTTRLIKATLAQQTSGFGGAGTSYTLGSSAASVSTTATASVVEKSSMTGTLTLAGGQPEAFALAYQTRYDTAALLADFAGSWQATLGPGIVNWTLASTGALTGTRTTGCTYTGQLSLRSESKAVVDAAVTETCATATTELSGVAVLTSDKTRIFMMLATANEATGVALSLAH